MIADLPQIPAKRDAAFHDIKIKMTPGGYGSSIELDGVPMKGVRNIRIECGVEMITTTYLEIITRSIEIEGVSQVTQGAVSGNYPGDEYDLTPVPPK